MTKVVINGKHGGFGLSRKAFLWLREKGNNCALEEADFGEFFSDGSGPRKELAGLSSFCREISRDNPDLIQVITKLKDEAGGDLSSLEIVEVPDGVKWHIEEYDGLEWVAEDHQTWR